MTSKHINIFAIPVTGLTRENIESRLADVTLEFPLHHNPRLCGMGSEVAFLISDMFSVEVFPISNALSNLVKHSFTGTAANYVLYVVLSEVKLIFFVMNKNNLSRNNTTVKRRIINSSRIKYTC